MVIFAKGWNGKFWLEAKMMILDDLEFEMISDLGLPEGKSRIKILLMW